MDKCQQTPNGGVVNDKCQLQYVAWPVLLEAVFLIIIPFGHLRGRKSTTTCGFLFQNYWHSNTVFFIIIFNNLHNYIPLHLLAM